MMLKKVVFSAAVLVGALAMSIVTAERAVAKGKPFIRCTTDQVGEIVTNTKNHQKTGGAHNPTSDVFSFAGGFGVLTGSPLSSKYHSLTRAVAIGSTIPDLDTRTDFPVTVTTTAFSIIESETNGSPLKGGTITVKSWIGTSAGTLTIDSYQKKGKKSALVTGHFSGTIPGIGQPTMNVTNGSFSVKVRIEGL